MTDEEKDQAVQGAIERALSPVITEHGLSGVDLFVVRWTPDGSYRRIRATMHDTDDPHAEEALDKFVREAVLDIIEPESDQTDRFDPRRKGN